MERDNLQRLSDMPKSFEINAARTEQRLAFVNRITAAIAEKDENNLPRRLEDKLAMLQNIQDNELDSLDSTQLTRLFMAYRDLGAFDKMIDLHDVAPNKDFTKAPMVREQLALAYNNVTFNKDPDWLSKTQVARRGAVVIGASLIEDGHKTGICYEAICRSFRSLADLSQSSEDRAAYRIQARQYAEEGFAETLESGIGILAVQQNIAFHDFDRAKELSKVVYLACLRDGAEESTDYFCVSSALFAACIAGESENNVNALLSQLGQCEAKEWEVARTQKAVDFVREKYPSPMLNKLSQRLGAWSMGDKPKQQKQTKPEEVLDAILSRSYNYRGMGSTFRGSHRVGGNMPFGGQLPDHAVSRRDIELFASLLEHTPKEFGLSKDPNNKYTKDVGYGLPIITLKDPEAFMAISDQLIRHTFMTENFAGQNLHMENNALDKDPVTGDSVYDATVKAFIRAAGKKLKTENELQVENEKRRSIDSRTNIAATFALGMGDCRHHAQAKQIMFDMWQRRKMNEQLSTMLQHVNDGAVIEKRGPERNAFFNVYNVELRTADVEVRMPIKMYQSFWKDKAGKLDLYDQMYQPVVDNDGKYVVNPTGKAANLEEHTLCWVVKKNDRGKLEYFGLRDAFYQGEHYAWGHMDIDASKVRVDEQGRPLIPAGQLKKSKLSDKDKGAEVPIVLAPTPYNIGKRDRDIQDTTGRDISLIGIPLDGFDSNTKFFEMVKDRKQASELMMAVLKEDQWLNPPQPKKRQEIIGRILIGENGEYKEEAKKATIEEAKREEALGPYGSKLNKILKKKIFLTKPYAIKKAAIPTPTHQTDKLKYVMATLQKKGR